jgi:SAM-dependent methyltransferase
MHYDPIKRQLGNLFNRSVFLRKLFYRLLDILLLRAWHVSGKLKQIRAEFPAGKLRILDAGSGFGQYCYRMAGLFPEAEILGVDVKQEQIDDCNRFFQRAGKGEQVRFEVADLTQFSSPDRYDLILSVDVMEHIGEDEKVFRNFSDSLREGGILLISTPSDHGGSDSDHHDEDGIHGFIEEHVRDGYNREEIIDKLIRAGFSGAEVTYTYGTFGSLAWRLSMKYPIQMLGVSRLFYLLLPFYYLAVFPFCALFNFIDVQIKNRKGTGLLVSAIK